MKIQYLKRNLKRELKTSEPELLRLILKVVQDDGSVDVTLPVSVKTLLKSSKPEEGYRKFLVNGRVQYRKITDISQPFKAKTVDEIKDWFYKNKTIALKFIEDEFKSDEGLDLERAEGD